jgi:hypothetical protein
LERISVFVDFIDEQLGNDSETEFLRERAEMKKENIVLDGE